MTNRRDDGYPDEQQRRGRGRGAQVERGYEDPGTGYPWCEPIESRDRPYSYAEPSAADMARWERQRTRQDLQYDGG